jgi:hypothetical protein
MTIVNDPLVLFPKFNLNLDRLGCINFRFMAHLPELLASVGSLKHDSLFVHILGTREASDFSTELLDLVIVISLEGGVFLSKLGSHGRVGGATVIGDTE